MKDLSFPSRKPTSGADTGERGNALAVVCATNASRCEYEQVINDTAPSLAAQQHDHVAPLSTIHVEGINTNGLFASSSRL